MSERAKLRQTKDVFNRFVKAHQRQRTNVLLTTALALRMHHWRNTEEETIRAAAIAHILMERNQWPDDWVVPEELEEVAH